METQQQTQVVPFWMTHPTVEGFTAKCEKEAERMAKSREASQVNGAYFVGAITEAGKGHRKS